MAYDKHNENRGQWFMRSPMGRVAGDGILSDDYSEESGGNSTGLLFRLTRAANNRPQIKGEAMTMRLWHFAMIEFLPDMQLKGQWRECALIADALAKNGTPNHLLVNRVTEYPLDHFVTYCFFVFMEMRKRGFNASNRATKKMEDLGKFPIKEPLFPDWHNLEYLRICYANLLEKHNGIGKSRISDEEWQLLCDGYKAITGEEYKI